MNRDARLATLFAGGFLILCGAGMLTPSPPRGVADNAPTLTPHSRGLSALPIAARGVVSATIGGDHQPYHVSRLRAANPAQRLRMRFSREGVTVATGHDHAMISVVAFGRPGALQAVPPVAPRVRRNRVKYEHHGLVAWYANGPLGLEQGFTVHARPDGGRAPLVVEMSLAGNLKARGDQGGVLLSAQGAQLRYGGLSAIDARGHALPARLSLRGGRLLVEVDDRAAVYPVRIDPFFQQGDKLIGTGATGPAQQGSSVALSADGNTALVAGWADADHGGAVWVFTRSGGIWSQQGDKLTPSDGTGATSVALSADGNTAIVGGSFDHGGDGAAYVYTRFGGRWSQEGDKLTVTGGGFEPEVGASVALSADGNTALLGAPDANSENGAAWVFTRSGTTWTQGDELAGTGADHALMGASVALSADGTTAALGGAADNLDSGATWVFHRSGGTWAQQGDKLVGTGGVGESHQGSSVALSADGNTALIGGRGDDQSVGATWVFHRSGDTWSEQGDKLIGTGAAGPAGQGEGVALSSDGNEAVIGGIGALWEFTRSGDAWTQQGDKLFGDGVVDFAGIGGVALSSDASTALEGGPADDNYTGATWVFSTAPPPTISAPASLDFGSGKVGQAGTIKWIDIENTGQGALRFTGRASVTGANAGEFSIPLESDQCVGVTLQPTETCSIGIQFTPSAEGSRSATLNLAHSNALVSPTVALTGTGATAATSPGGPGCTANVKFGLIDADGCFKRTGDVYRATDAITLNGISMTPHEGSAIVLDKGTGEIRTEGNRGAILSYGPIELADTALHWTPPTTAPPSGVTIGKLDVTKTRVGGLPVSGSIGVRLTKGGTALDVALQLPPPLASASAQTTLVTKDGQKFSLGSLKLSAKDLDLGFVRVVDFSMAYDPPTDTWTGALTLILPPNGYGMGVTATLVHGKLRSLGASVDHLNAPFIFGLYLQRIALTIGGDPTTTWNPFDVSGGIGVTVGPELPPIPPKKDPIAALRVDGNFEWRFSNPWKLHVDGTVKSGGIQVGQGYVDVYPGQSIDAAIKVDLGWPTDADPKDQTFKLSGTAYGWTNGDKYDIEAGLNMTLMKTAVAGVQGVFSDVGIAACGKIAWLEAGFGYTRADDHWTLMGPLVCDIGPYRSAGVKGAVFSGSAAAAGTGVLRFAGRTGERIIKLIGATAPPQLTLDGPGGQHIATRPDGKSEVTSHYVVLSDSASHTTYIAIRHPAGTWRMRVARGSVLRGVLAAGTLPAPHVTATLAGRGRSRMLRYAITAPRGDRVRFAEVGHAASRLLATVNPGRGSIRFAPTAGPGGTRRIVAIVLDHGLPEHQQTVARFRSSAPRRLSAPTRLHARRLSTGLAVSWRPVAGADVGYAIRLAISGGASRVVFVRRGQTSITFTAVPAGAGAAITVNGLAGDGLPGTAVRVVVAPGRGA